jgi:hypothetical protein
MSRKGNKLADGNIRNWNSEVVAFFEEMRKGCQNLDKSHWKYFSSVTHQFVDTGNAHGSYYNLFT